MNPKWLRLAAALLGMASESYSNHGCNDFDFPAEWTTEDKQELVKAMHMANRGNLDDYEPDHLNMPDWWLMSFLADRLLDESGEVKSREDAP